MTAASLGSRLRASGVWAATGRIFSGVLLLAMHAVLARFLDGAAYGQFVLAESMALLIVTLCLAGVPSVALRMIRERLIQQNASAAADVARSSVGLVLVTSLGAMVVLWIAACYLPGPLPGGLSRHWLIWISAWAIFATGLRLLSEIYKGYDWYAAAFGIGGQSGGLWVNGVLFLSIVVLAATGLLSLRTAFLMQLLVPGTTMLLSAVHLNRRLGKPVDQRIFGSVAVYRLMVLSAWPLLAEQMVSVGLPEAGKLMLGTFSTAEAVGLYNAALRLVLLAHVPLLVINSAIQPFVAELHAARRIDRLTALTRGSATIACIPSVILLAIFFVGPEQILELAFGPEFIAAAPALRWLVAGALAFVLSGSCGLVLIMTGRERECMLATILPGLVYIVACPFAVRQYGVTGAAACAAGLYVATNGLCLLLVRVQLGMWTSVTLSTNIFRDCLQIIRRRPSVS